MTDPTRPPAPGDRPLPAFEELEAVRLAERIIAERLGLAAEAASAYLEGIAKATSTGLVVVATILVESGELPRPREGDLAGED